MKGVRQNRFKEKRKPKNFKKTIIRLWEYFKFKKKLLLIVLLLVIADSFLVIISPYLIGKAVDYIDFKELNLLNITLIVLIASYLIDLVIQFFQNFIIYSIGQHVVKNIREEIFIKFQKLPIIFFDNEKSINLNEGHKLE